MRKILSVPIIIVLLYVANNSKATYGGVPLGVTNLYKKLDLRAGNYLKEMIILPEEEFDELEVSKMIERIDLLPESILYETNKQQIKIVFFNGQLTDQVSTMHLKGKVPRGHPAHIVWDDLPGVGGSKLVHVKIGASERGKGHGSVNLELHELAHSLKRFIYNDEERAVIFTSIWKNEAKYLFPGERYFLDYEEEYFAESFAYYFYTEETRRQLKELAPKTFKFFSQL